MTRRPAEAGFTLIEVVIALALFGLIASAGLALVEGVLGIEARTAGRLDRLAELDRALYVVTRDIEQAADADIAGGGAVLRLGHRAPAAGGATIPLDYALAGGTISRTLCGPGGGQGQRLLTGVATLQWRFYAPGRGWVAGWPAVAEEARAWPLAIEARIALADDGRGPTGTLRRVVALPARP